MFNAITDALGQARIFSQETESAGRLLRQAQRRTEEMYLDAGETRDAE